MRLIFTPFAALIMMSPSFANAQCFNRNTCADDSRLEIRSQISINVPVADQAGASDTIKTMEDARRDLYALSGRECDVLKSIYGGDCSLSSVNINSSIQDRGLRSKTAFISISNTYEIKKSVK